MSWNPYGQGLGALGTAHTWAPAGTLGPPSLKGTREGYVYDTPPYAIVYQGKSYVGSTYRAAYDKLKAAVGADVFVQTRHTLTGTPPPTPPPADAPGTNNGGIIGGPTPGPEPPGQDDDGKIFGIPRTYALIGLAAAAYFMFKES